MLNQILKSVTLASFVGSLVAVTPALAQSSRDIHILVDEPGVFGFSLPRREPNWAEQTRRALEEGQRRDEERIRSDSYLSSLREGVENMLDPYGVGGAESTVARDRIMRLATEYSKPLRDLIVGLRNLEKQDKGEVFYGSEDEYLRQLREAINGSTNPEFTKNAISTIKGLIAMSKGSVLPAVTSDVLGLAALLNEADALRKFPGYPVDLNKELLLAMGKEVRRSRSELFVKFVDEGVIPLLVQLRSSYFFRNSKYYGLIKPSDFNRPFVDLVQASPSMIKIGAVKVETPRSCQYLFF
jgi:hypothetical protein